MTTPTHPKNNGEQSPERAAGNGFLGDLWTSFLRWNLRKRREPFVLLFALVEPVIFLVLFSQVFGQLAAQAVPEGNYLTYLLPAIVVQSALITAAGSGIGFVQDIETGMFEKTLVSPMSRTAMFAGKALSDLVLITLPVVILLGLGYVLGARVTTGVLGAVGILGVTLVFSVWYTAFSNILGVVTRSSRATGIGTNIVHLPLLFASSALVPADALPRWLQMVSAVNPITYGVDAARALMLDGWSWGIIGQSLVVLGALDIMVGLLAVYLLTRASSAEVQ